jgi:hypothetical protein
VEFRSIKERPVYLCSHVFENTRPVLLVSRADGDWQFLCGGEHDKEVPSVVGFNHLLEKDPTLAELRDLPDEWEAERAGPGLPWRITRPVAK